MKQKQLLRTLLAALCLLVGTNAWAETLLIDYPSTKTNINFSGTTKETQCQVNGVKIPCYQLANGYTSNGKNNGNTIRLYAEGGFKAGDKITIGGVINNADNTKYGTVVVFSGGFNKSTTTIKTLDNFVNVNGNENIPVEQSFILTTDVADSLYLGRNGNTGTMVTLIKIDRPSSVGTLVHTASSNCGSDKTVFSSSVDAETEKYHNEGSQANQGYAFAQFTYTVPADKYIKNALLVWSATNLNTNADRTSKVYYLNSGKSIDYEELQSSPSSLRFNGEKTWVKDIATSKGVSAISDETDVTAAVRAVQAQGYVIFQWTGIAGGANLNGKASSSKPLLILEYADLPFSNGDYYFRNKATGAYFAAGKNWGTQAITNTQGGHRVGLEASPTATYKLNTYIYRDQSSSSDLHYLNANFCDGAAEEWQIVDAGEGYYTISNASGNLTGGDVNEALSITDGTGDNTKWQILTAAQRKADIETLMESATSANGVDATFYITAPEFAWADLDDRAAWQGSPTFGGFDNQGSGRFWNAEKFTDPYATFDVYQELTGLKPGAYKITMQGFYRNGFDNASDPNDNLAVLYANNSEVALKNIRYYEYTDDSHSADGFTENKSGYFVPNSQSDAAKAFNAGNFENELYVVVGNDGNLRIGVKKDAPTGANADWTVFDNFQLTYYGNTVSATITPTGYATFSSPYALDFSNQIENLEGAYYASAVETGKVTMTKLEQAVPAETGLFLKGTAGKTVTIPVVASGTTINGTNHLKPNTTAKEIAASKENAYHYVFAYTTSDGSNPGFFNLASPVTLGAGKAYIETPMSIKPTAGAKVSILFTDTELTGIVNAEANETTNAKAGKIYNIAGQVVNESYKGIKIIDGKKVF